MRTAVLQNPAFTRVDAVSNRASSDYNSLQMQFKRRFSKGFQAQAAYTWSKSLDTASDESISNFSAPILRGDPNLDLGQTNIARPDRVPSQPLYLVGDCIPGGKRLNPAAFDGTTPLAQGRQGTLGRNVMRGFGVNQVDLSVRRRFQILERMVLNFRADAFNISNSPNFGNPSGVLTASTFGVSTAILSSQLGSFGLNPHF